MSDILMRYYMYCIDNNDVIDLDLMFCDIVMFDFVRMTYT